MHAAESALGSLLILQEIMNGAAATDLNASPSSRFDSVISALRDDLNTPAALGALFKIRNEIVHSSAPKVTAADAAAFKAVTQVLGISVRQTVDLLKPPLPQNIVSLAEKRWTAKQAKDFATADALRKEIAAAGWSMLDRKDGYSLEPVKR